MSHSLDTNRSGVKAVEIVQHWTEADDARQLHQPVHALVTGANGFIGRHLAERLLGEGKRVRLYVRRPETVEELRRLGAEVDVGSLDDVETLKSAAEGVETVFHLAAMTCALRPEDLLRCNGDGARNVAQACAAQRHRPTLVHVSSIAASGPARRGELRREIDEPRPISNYGRSKLAGELAVAQFAGELPITIVRPGIVFGPRNLEMLPMFRTIKYAHFHPIAGWRTPALSLIHVDDTLDVILRAAERGSRLTGEEADGADRLTSGRGVYFAAAPEYPDYAELGRMMRTLLRRPFAPILPLLRPAAWLAAGLSEQISWLRGQPSTFNVDKIREATAESWAVSVELAERELGCSPRQSLHERMRCTVDWYQENRWL